MLFARVHFHRQRATFGQTQGGLKAFRQALLHVGANFQTVHDHIHVVFFVFLQLWQVIEIKHLLAQAKTHIALCLQVGQQFIELAFARTGDRGQHHQLGVFGQRQHRIHHLRHALGLQRQAMLWAIRRACARKQQAQVVMDFGDRAHGGAGVVAGGLLLNRDRRRQAFDQVDIGFVHQLQKLAGVGGQAFDIPALAFGIQGVKRQAGLARA